MGKLQEHTTALYRALDAAATTETLNGREERMFRGSITEAYRSLGISQSYYSEVRKGLVDSGSISIMRQGTKGTKSIIVLHSEPDNETLVSLQSLGLTNEAQAGMVLQELKDLKRLIGSISIPDALVEMERRMQEMDNRIITLEQKLIKQGR